MPTLYYYSINETIKQERFGSVDFKMKRFWEKCPIPFYRIVIFIITVIMMVLGAYFGKLVKEDKEKERKQAAVYRQETIEIEPEDIKKQIEEDIKRIEENRVIKDRNIAK